MNQTRYLVHRVVWLLHSGEDPYPFSVDHIGSTFDNSVSNLRLVTNAQNCANRVMNARGTLNGYKGVAFHKPSGRYVARIKVDGAVISLRYHDTAEQAAQAYNREAVARFGEYARLNLVGRPGETVAIAELFGKDRHLVVASSSSEVKP